VSSDEFSLRYSDLLTGSYDCVDRIVLNAFFPLGHNPGGFRVWWRRWHDDSDAELDNTHLMRLAGRFARRVKAWGAATRSVPRSASRTPTPRWSPGMPINTWAATVIAPTVICTTQGAQLKSARERMNIISSYRQVGTGGAELCGTTHKTVRGPPPCAHTSWRGLSVEPRAGIARMTRQRRHQPDQRYWGFRNRQLR
jgi:hypothetical protein